MARKRKTGRRRRGRRNPDHRKTVMYSAIAGGAAIALTTLVLHARASTALSTCSALGGLIQEGRAVL